MFDQTPVESPSNRRRRQTEGEIVAAAWQICRTEGLTELSMRSLAPLVGLKAPTLYSYFESKDCIYDAMFREGNEELLARIRAQGPVDASKPLAELIARTERFVAFCVEDPTRYQLLFQRVVPGFEPSPESYAVAVEVLSSMAADFAAIGVDDPAALDLWTAIVTGLTDQQISNDPGGDRWTRLLDRAADMFLAHLHNEQESS